MLRARFALLTVLLLTATVFEATAQVPSPAPTPPRTETDSAASRVAGPAETCKTTTTTTTTCEAGACKEVVTTVKACVPAPPPPLPTALPVASRAAQQADSANDFVVVGLSAGETVGLTGQELTGTYAVSLGRYTRPPAAPASPQQVVPLSIGECTNATVEFALITPKSAGFAPQGSTTQSGRFYFGDEARRRFPDNYADLLNPSDSAAVAALIAERRALKSEVYKPAGRPGTLTPEQRRDKEEARRKRLAEIRDRLAALISLCIAEAPLKLGEAIGQQYVIATIRGSGLGHGADRHQAGRFVARTGAGSVQFKSIRVHARPRLMGGIIWSAGDRIDLETYTLNAIPEKDLPPDFEGEAFTKEQTYTLSRPRIEPLIGFDFPLEPYFGRWPSGLHSIRPSLGVVLDDKTISALYLGLGVSTLRGVRGGSFPVDLTAGFLLDTSAQPDDVDDARVNRFAVSVTVDAKGVLASLAKAVGVSL